MTPDRLSSAALEAALRSCDIAGLGEFADCARKAVKRNCALDLAQRKRGLTRLETPHDADRV